MKMATFFVRFIQQFYFILKPIQDLNYFYLYYIYFYLFIIIYYIYINLFIFILFNNFLHVKFTFLARCALSSSVC